jgi:hypothetical protein
MTDEITKIRKEIGDLKLELARLHELLKGESDNTTYHIKFIYDHLKILDDRSIKNRTIHRELIFKLYDMIEPIEEKLFPGVSRAREQLAAIIEKARLDPDIDHDEKKP